MKYKDKPLLVFDGQCGFCRLWIDRWKTITKERIDYAPFQEVAAQFPEIPLVRFQASVQFIEPDGKISSGAEAVFRSLACVPNKEWMLWCYRKLPGFATIAEWFYRQVAAHRDAALVVTKCLWGKHVLPPTYLLSQWLFLRLLAVIFFIAFVSLWTQILGLVGQNGILPASTFLDVIRERFGLERYLLVPTLCWFHASDPSLYLLCGGGTFLSVLLFFGIAPSPVLLLLWLFYLSLASVCRDFLAFQWDVLLLETAFLAIFLAPPILRRHTMRMAPTRVTLWLLRWLLFRLLFSSAAVKWLSGDPTWKNLTALKYHYETQPLPTWVTWYAHQLPGWFQEFSVLLVFLVEGLAPLLIFCPRRLRHIGFCIQVGFQVLIFLTGNYCFFNLLAIALCFLVLDDFGWPRRIAEKLTAVPTQKSPRQWPRPILIPVSVFLLFLSVVQMGGTLRWDFSSVPLLIRLDRWAAPFRTVNGYGLFAVMTTTRQEIIIEGSSDGVRWLPYEFKYKPGDPKRRPEFVEPHQPRLDWQMWFAALETYQSNEWFIPFCVRILEGSPEVLALLSKNPFPDIHPKYVRASVYEYHFTDLNSKLKTGAWWKSERKGLYCPVFSLREGFSNPNAVP